MLSGTEYPNHSLWDGRQRAHRSHPTPPVPGSAWACLASRNAYHSTAPARLARGREEVPGGSTEESDAGKEGGVRGHGFVSHTPEREPWCQLVNRDVVKKEIYAQVRSQDGVGDPEASIYQNELIAGDKFPVSG